MSISTFKLPPEILDEIAPFLSDPTIFSRVAKSVSIEIILEPFYGEIWQAYTHKPELTREVQEVTALKLQTKFASVKAVYQKVIDRAGPIPIPPANASYVYAPDRLTAISISRATNLCDFFTAFANSVSDTFYEAKQFLQTLEGTPLSKEAAIITWMNRNSAILAAFKTLELSKCQLTALPAQIGLFTGLTSLDLSHNPRLAIPVEIGQCAKLQRLNLSHNQFTTLPSAIRQCTHLKDLNLSHNKLSTIPEMITECLALEHLILCHNRFTAIPAIISQCTRLVNIDFSHNQITTLPDEIMDLNSLEYLFLSHNLLTTIPAKIGKHPKLEILDFSNNRITLTHQEILAFFPPKRAEYLVLNTKSNTLKEKAESKRA